MKSHGLVRGLVLAASMLVAGAASAAQVVNVDFRDPHALKSQFTNESLATFVHGSYKYQTSYWDSLDLDLGNTLSLSVSALAYPSGNHNKPELGDRAVYFMPDITTNGAAPDRLGLGVESVKERTGPLLGIKYVEVTGGDGSPDVDVMHGINKGHDILKLEFNREVTLDQVAFSMFTGAYGDRAKVYNAAGQSVTLDCQLTCARTSYFPSTPNTPFATSLTGSVFYVEAMQSGIPGLPTETTAFRLAGLTVTDSFTPAVPEPETYAMLLAGLGLVAGVARRRRPLN